MEELQQPPISVFAVASLALAALSVASFLAIVFWPLAPVAIVTAFVSLRSCRRYEFVGARGAWGGLALSVLVLFAAPVWHFSLYWSESAASHVRLDFESAMRGSPRAIDRYFGQSVCLKGYGVFRGKWDGLQAFEFSIDGDNRIKGRSVVVVLTEGQTWEWSDEPIAVSGTLIRDGSEGNEENGNPPLRLIDATVRPVRTTYGLAAPSGHGC